VEWFPSLRSWRFTTKDKLSLYCDGTNPKREIERFTIIIPRLPPLVNTIFEILPEWKFVVKIEHQKTERVSLNLPSREEDFIASLEQIPIQETT
jgi:hypothetical protein